MLKIPRFMKEYFNYIVRRIKESERTKQENEILMIRANRFLFGYSKGLITVEEAMRALTSLLYEIRWGVEEE